VGKAVIEIASVFYGGGVSTMGGAWCPAIVSEISINLSCRSPPRTTVISKNIEVIFDPPCWGSPTSKAVFTMFASPAAI
jgi:hypothetical protein